MGIQGETLNRKFKAKEEKIDEKIATSLKVMKGKYHDE